MLRDVIGHDRIVQILRRQIAEGRVGNAYLFVGPPDVGKGFVALNFAKALNCLQGGDDSCDICISCRKIDDGLHPDVQVISPSGSWLKIDQIRAMRRRAALKPLEGRFKVFIIREADRMTDEAANSLLKTLEEPPTDTVIILITTNLSAILPTITSRCQLFRFGAVPKEEIEGFLRERFNLSDQAASRIALLSDGRVSRAIEMARNPGLAEEAPPRLLTGMEPIEIFREAEEIAGNPEKLEVLLTWLRDLMLVKAGVREGIVHVGSLDLLRSLASRLPRGRLLEAVKLVMRTRQLITQHNVNPNLALEVMCLKLLELQGRI